MSNYPRTARMWFLVLAVMLSAVAAPAAADPPSLRASDGPWMQSTYGLYGGTINALALSPQLNSDRTAFAGTQTGVFRSTNGGLSWAAAHEGLR